MDFADSKRTHGAGARKMMAVAIARAQEGHRRDGAIADAGGTCCCSNAWRRPFPHRASATNRRPFAPHQTRESPCKRSPGPNRLDVAHGAGARARRRAGALTRMEAAAPIIVARMHRRRRRRRGAGSSTSASRRSRGSIGAIRAVKVACLGMAGGRTCSPTPSSARRS